MLARWGIFYLLVLKTKLMFDMDGYKSKILSSR